MSQHINASHTSSSQVDHNEKDFKVAYLLHWNIFREDGVIKKIRTQVECWKQSVEVKLFVITPSADSATMASSLEAEVFPYTTLKTRLKSTSHLTKRVFEWKPDMIYFRYNPPYPPLPKLFRSIPTVVELNTDDVEEYRLGSVHRYWYNRLTRGNVYRPAAGLVSVSYELTQLPNIMKYHKQTLVLANAIDLKTYPQLPVPDNQRPRLAFMGAERLPWHGEDKITWLAQQLPEFDFDFIGTDGKRLDLPPNATAYGYLARDEYEQVLRKTDVAIGTLALHRKHMKEACPLKVREYLAFGLPTIIAYQDTDFMEGAEFLLSIPNTEDNAQTHLDGIRKFVHAQQGQRVPREAISHIDAVHKEQQRLDFMGQFIS